MIQKYALLLLMIGSNLLSVAQDNQFEPVLKLGKPSKEELSMTVYQPDTTASALVLYKNTELQYDYVKSGFRVNYYNEGKIKILKNEGTSYADFTIPYYNNTDVSQSMKEGVIQIEANAYNLVNGKIEQTKMKKEFIFKERLNDKYMQVKFSIPGAKAGSVVEYKYTIYSDFYFDINRWNAQSDIPTLYTKYTATIPEYFKFNIDKHGYEELESSNSNSSINFIVGAETISCMAQKLSFTGRNLPALKGDNYTWCISDFGTQVNLELNRVEFFGYHTQSFTQTWQDIDELIIKNSDFGGQLKMRNPLKDEMILLGKLDELSHEEKTCKIFNFLRTLVSWNGTYDLYGGNAKKVIKEGTGSNAEINFILMSMLKEAGIKCYPVIMSMRSTGRLPQTHPTIKKFNTFIVAVENPDGTVSYIDGSVNNGYMDVLPPNIMPNQARAYVDHKNGSWVDLSKIGKNQIRAALYITLHEDGKMEGTRSCNLIGQYASQFRRYYKNAKDSIDYISKISENDKIKINNYKIENLNEFTPIVTEVMDFEKHATTSNDYIYLNPLVFLHAEKNPFIQSERKFPIEQSHTENVSLNINITIPEGYAIEELPEGINVTTDDREGRFRYMIAQEGNKVNLRYTYQNSKLVYLPTEYKELQNLWKVIVEKNNEMIVLKKI